MRLVVSVALLSGVMSLAVPALAASDDMDLGFETAFHRPFYKKKSFGLVMTGTTVIAAGVVSYLTAGAGAPPAAAGVSTVASWVAGGGAGSYMAGASIVGGWFGGNALLGAAILNGISLGTVGAPTTWAALSAGQKAVSLGSAAATILDGIAVISMPDTKQLHWHVTLPVPISLADDRTRDLLDSLIDASDDVAEGVAKLKSAESEQPSGSPKSTRVLDAERTLDAAIARHKTTARQMDDELARVLSSGSSNHTTVVMAVIAHNAGRSDHFRTLLSRINVKQLKKRSYLDYLLAVGELQMGKVSSAGKLLQNSWTAAPFAIEPALLLASLAGTPGFKANEPKINEIVNYAEKNFGEDKYVSSASLVSLHYRVGSMALVAKRCDRALVAFKKAQEKQAVIGKYFTAKDTRDLLEIGEANALYCQGKHRRAHEIFNAVWQRTSSEDAKNMLCAQYTGGCAR